MSVLAQTWPDGIAMIHFMITWNEIERLKREAAALGRSGAHLAIVLSMVLSLTAIVILSRQNLTNQLWMDGAALAIPMPIALYFRNRIAVLGALPYSAALLVAFAAAVAFGL